MRRRQLLLSLKYPKYYSWCTYLGLETSAVREIDTFLKCYFIWKKSSSKIQVMFLKKSRTFSSKGCHTKRKKRPTCSLRCVFSQYLQQPQPVIPHLLSLHLFVYAIYRSLTFSGVTQEAKGAVHQTRVEEEVVTLVLMSLPSCLKSIIWRCSSGLMNLSQKVMISVTTGR